MDIINEINEIVNNLNIFYFGQWDIHNSNVKGPFITGFVKGSILRELINQENNIESEFIYSVDIYINNNEVLISYTHQQYEYIKTVSNIYTNIFFRLIRRLEN